MEQLTHARAKAKSAEAKATPPSTSSGGTKVKKSNSMRAKLFKMSLYSESQC